MNAPKGYTLVEILIVVSIVAILATISGPAFLQHQKKAVASEAVAAMSLIRQAQRDYHINTDHYYDVTSGNIANGFPTSVTAGTPTPSTAGVDVDVGVSAYFSNQAFTVDATSPTSARFTSPPPVDFLVLVNGAASVKCTSSVVTNCAIKADKVSQYDLEMDNSGRVYVSYDNGTNWQAY